MAKDPAVLFYTSDFLAGTILMNHEERGVYITLLCVQHQSGHLPEAFINKLTESSLVKSKFIKDKKGLYYNERMEEEHIKRKAYCKSRGNNKKGKTKKIISKSYEKHMEDENEDGNKGKYGNYKRIILTDKQYSKLVEDFGESFIKLQIDKVDEYLQTNDNKNKYKDFNLVLRKSIREGWFKSDNVPAWFNAEIKEEKASKEDLEEIENMFKKIGG